MNLHYVIQNINMRSIPKQDSKATRSDFPIPPVEKDLDSKIGKLNQGLQLLINEIEVKSNSENHSNLSILDSQHTPNDDKQTNSFISKDNLLSGTIESRLGNNFLHENCKQMIIEDFWSEEIRRLTYPEYQDRVFISELRKENELLKEKLNSCSHCSHCSCDLNTLRKEIWLQIKMEESGQNEKARKRFEESLEHLDRLKEDYEKKRAEIMQGIEKLKLKEELLVQKEKEAREQRLAFNRHKLLWCREHGISDPYTPFVQSTDSVEDQGNFTVQTQKTMAHARASSASSTDISSYSGKQGFASLLETTPKVKDNGKSTPFLIRLAPDSEFANKAEQLRFYQSELRILETQLENIAGGPVEEISNLEINIDQLKNRIATIRGDIAMSESAKAKKVISSMIVSMSRDAIRDEKSSRGLISGSLTKRIHQKSYNDLRISERVPIKVLPIDNKISNKSEIPRQGADSGNSRSILVANKAEHSKISLDYQKKKLLD